MFRTELITIKLLNDLKQELVDNGLITADQLRKATIELNPEDENIGRVLIDKGFVSSEKLLDFLGERLQIPFVDLDNYDIDKDVVKLIPMKAARASKAIPLFMIEGVLTVAMADPVDIISLDNLIKITGCHIEPVIASETSIVAALAKVYGKDTSLEEIEELADKIKEIRAEAELEYEKEITEISRVKEPFEPPIIKLVNKYVAQAMLERASDIHFESKKDLMAVRFRIDGVLFSRDKIPLKLIPKVVARIKIISGMDISNRREPQDGRISLIIGDQNVDIRTSTFPSMYGENVVLRLLDRGIKTPSLTELGFSESGLSIFKRIIKSQKGMVLATGPTGSGKTTTIYSIINSINKADKSIMTIEDPIEYEIDGVVQSQINVGVSFAGALKSILRQDPDIIYVGEIRDLETSEIAVRASLTGHLVLSTIHTKNAIGTILRLIDIGLDPNLVSSVLHCSFSQRLVRRTCTKCMKEYSPDKVLLESYGLSPELRYYKGEGCGYCNNIGYKGRVGIFEILVVDDDIRRLISANASEDDIFRAAKKQGMRTLVEDGLEKVREGLTTIEEVERVLL
jgi:type IV pilus assembly protein PilB